VTGVSHPVKLMLSSEYGQGEVLKTGTPGPLPPCERK